MHRGWVERGPAGIALGGIVAVLVTVADRGDGPPEIVGVLGVPIHDVGVGQAHVEQREQAGTFGEREPLLDREFARRRLPGATEIDVAPELHRRGLLGSTRRALGAAQALDLVVVAGPLRARQCWRRARPELVRALEYPWPGARILLPQRRRRRYVYAGGSVRAVRVGSVGAVGGALGLDRVGDRYAHLDAFGLGEPVRDRLDRCRVNFLDLGL